MFCCDIARAYRQLPLDPADWPLVCRKTQGRYCIDISLLFGLCWATACCQGITRLIIRVLKEEDINVMAYIDDIVTQDKDTVQRQFNHLRDTLQQLGLQEALHKVTPPYMNMVSFNLAFINPTTATLTYFITYLTYHFS